MLLRRPARSLAMASAALTMWKGLRYDMIVGSNRVKLSGGLTNKKSKQRQEIVGLDERGTYGVGKKMQKQKVGGSRVARQPQSESMKTRHLRSLFHFDITS